MDSPGNATAPPRGGELTVGVGLSWRGNGTTCVDNVLFGTAVLICCTITLPDRWSSSSPA